MTPRGLVGLDIDGTILLQDETLSPGVVEAIAQVRDAGYETMLATGRSWAGTRRYVEQLELTSEFTVCSNGAVIMRRVDDEWVRWRVEVFDAKPVLGLLRDRLPEARYMVELASGQRLYTATMDDWTLDGGREVEFDELAAQPVSRVVVVSPEHDEADFQRLVAEAGLNEVSYAIGWTAWLDIAPLGVDKGTALERVRAELGIPRDRVLVAGDGRNDLGMFAWSLAEGGRAVAMGQAPDEVKDAAGEQTAVVDDGGLAIALRTLL
ncbi:HAD family hydrolase [Microbacterium sp. ARD32]|uniref:HAD family hydrolase n=1 Tax=Microbacterium sp. ARD32 TaxID=2962577 RepID=UPI0028821084|nr:HAD family hydrolase [Microbacterium sp. ARD32]MDT0156177.1 HAD family hydrolase [Microbacterium sp. ARD32]